MSGNDSSRFGNSSSETILNLSIVCVCRRVEEEVCMAEEQKNGDNSILSVK